MSKKKESTETEEVTKVKEKPPKKKTPQDGPLMLISQYYHQYVPNIRKYVKAYVSAKYRDTLKMKDEWANELTKTM